MTKQKQTFDAVLLSAETAQAQLADAWQNVAQNMLGIARDLSDVAAFLAGAGQAESARRERLNADAQAHKWSDEERRRRLRLPQSWSNAKSQIKRVWQEYGVHPKEFRTYYALRTRLSELRAKTHQTPRRLTEAPDTPAGQAARAFLARLFKLPDEYQLRIIESADRLARTYEGFAAQIETPQRAAAVQ